MFILLCFNSLPTINYNKRRRRKKILFWTVSLKIYCTLQYRKVVVDLFHVWAKCIFLGYSDYIVGRSSCMMSAAVVPGAVEAFKYTAKGIFGFLRSPEFLLFA